MQTTEQLFFLNCLTKFLNGKPFVYTECDINWDELFLIAADQSMEAVIFYQCQSILPEEIKRKYYKQYLAHSVVSIKRKNILEEIIAHCQKQGIQVLFMKGAVFRDLYPIPALRSMGDIDCVVRMEDRNAIDEILQKKMGFERSIDNHAVWRYGKGNLYFEIHVHMFYEYLANDFDYRGYFDRVWEHSHKADVFGIHSDVLFVPDEEYHFLYLIVHTAKHMTNKGSGFRPYLDMALLVQQWMAHMDWNWIEQELKRLQLLTFTKVCFSLCEQWFDVQMPFEKKELSDEFVAKATSKTFHDGLFGLVNAENDASRSAKEMKRSRLPRILTILILTWKRIFPSYKDMQLVPWYSFIDGKPWLMPYAWVYRWVYCLKNKRKTGTDLLTEPFVKGDIITARENWLRQWGL